MNNKLSECHLNGSNKCGMCQQQLHVSYATIAQHTLYLQLHVGIQNKKFVVTTTIKEGAYCKVYRGSNIHVTHPTCGR